MREKVKDCSNCDKPHRHGGYEHVIARLTRYFEELHASDPMNSACGQKMGSGSVS